MAITIKQIVADLGMKANEAESLINQLVSEGLVRVAGTDKDGARLYDLTALGFVAGAAVVESGNDEAMAIYRQATGIEKPKIH